MRGTHGLFDLPAVVRAPAGVGRGRRRLPADARSAGPDPYHRQKLVPGWDQDRVARASVAIVGGDWIAGYCALCLSCLGVGRIYILDSARAPEEERYFFTLSRGRSRAQGWADWLAALGVPVRVIARRSSPIYGREVILPPVDAVIGAVNGFASCRALSRYAAGGSVPVVVGAAGETEGWCQVAGDRAMTTPPSCYELRRQGALPSPVLAALMVGEIRRFLCPLPGDGPMPPCHVLSYGLARRFDKDSSESPELDMVVSRRHRVMLVGAGALGNFVALGLMLRADIELLIVVDPDRIASVNLNRLPLGFGSVGDWKSGTVMRRLNDMQGTMRVESVPECIASEHFDRWQPDLVLTTVDNFSARKLVHDQCVARGIPLLNGGTAALSGHLETYHPGRTCCLDCLYGLGVLAARESGSHSKARRCQLAPEPSTAISNALIGALMACEVGHSLNAQSWGRPLDHIIRYDAMAPLRIARGRVRKPCSCGGSE